MIRLALCRNSPQKYMFITLVLLEISDYSLAATKFALYLNQGYGQLSHCFIRMSKLPTQHSNSLWLIQALSVRYFPVAPWQEKLKLSDVKCLTDYSTDWALITWFQSISCLADSTWKLQSFKVWWIFNKILFCIVLLKIMFIILATCLYSLYCSLL